MPGSSKGKRSFSLVLPKEEKLPILNRAMENESYLTNGRETGAMLKPIPQVKRGHGQNDLFPRNSIKTEDNDKVFKSTSINSRTARECNDKHEVKRPVALIAQRCECDECQRHGSIYLSNIERYKLVREDAHQINKRNIKSGADQQEYEAKETFYKTRKGSNRSHFMDQLLSEKNLAVGVKEEESKDHDERSNDERRKLCFDATGHHTSCLMPRDCRMHQCSYEVKKEEKNSKRKFSTLKQEEIEGEILEVDRSVTDPYKHGLENFRQMKPNGIQMNGYSRSGMNHLKEGKMCSCIDCSTSNKHVISSNDEEMGLWLTKRSNHCQLAENSGFELEVEHESLENRCYEGGKNLWMTKSYEKRLENKKTVLMKSEKVSKSLVENEDESKRTNNVSKRYLDLKESIKKKDKTAICKSLNNDEIMIEDKSICKGSLQRIIDTKKSEEETEEEEAFNITEFENFRSKEKKGSMKQQKEKDPGKKSRALANWLERKRVAELNDAFERLRKMVPTYGNEDRSLSKIKTLRYATTYIGHLALINEKQCRFGIQDLKSGLTKVLDIDPMLQRCQEHLESHCII